MRAALEAVQIHGGYGYTEEYPVARYLRDAKLKTLGEGTLGYSALPLRFLRALPEKLVACLETRTCRPWQFRSHLVEGTPRNRPSRANILVRCQGDQDLLSCHWI